jgi:hypothetical protein
MIGEALHKDLPPRAAELAEVIGLAATLRLVEGWGGLRQYVPAPAHLHADHPLVRQLGREAARRLAEHYAREKIDVPRCLSALRAARDRRIVAEHEQGASGRELAMRYQLTERQIWTILAREQPENPTGDLFAG